MTINLSRQTSDVLEEIARSEGVSADELADRAVREYLFLRRFRTLRQRLADPSKSPLTDQDVFDQVS